VGRKREREKERKEGRKSACCVGAGTEDEERM